MEKLIAPGCPTDAEIGRLTEIKATRDVLVHGQGVANPTYLRKAGVLARAALQQPLPVTPNYHCESWSLLRKIVSDVGTAAAAKA